MRSVIMRSAIIRSALHGCAIAIALASTCGPLRDEPEARAPYVAIRALETLQDQIAAGDTVAAAAHAKTLAHTAVAFASMKPAVWTDRRNARALVLYLFSGGNASKIAADIPRNVVAKDEQALYDGAIAYGLGQDENARDLLLPIAAKSLPSSLGGHLALVQAALLANADKATAIERLDLARLLMPGTLVEEAALRQEMMLIDVGKGDLSKFTLLARRYRGTFARSVYSSNFQQLVKGAAIEVGAGDSADAGARLALILETAEANERCRLYLAIARDGLLDGRFTMATLASEAARRLAQKGSAEQARASLYLGAATIAGPRYDLGRKALMETTNAPLDDDDRALSQSAVAVADMIRDPSFAVQPAGRGADIALFDNGEQALKAADSALTSVQK